MHDASPMREVDCQANVAERLQQPALRPGAARILVAGLKIGIVGQRHASNPLHREEAAAVGIDAQIVNRHHGGMLELTLHARFPQKASFGVAPPPSRITLTATAPDLPIVQELHDAMPPRRASAPARSVR
jgi:hypothetical protein